MGYSINIPVSGTFFDYASFFIEEVLIMMFKGLSRILIGKPLESDQVEQERIPKWKALPIFSSDALSSVGYGPEQIAIVLAAMPALG